LHQLSSSSSATSVSPTRQPSTVVPPSSRSTHRTSHHVHRHASLSVADKPSPVKRSNSASSRATKPIHSGRDHSKSSRSGSGARAEEHTVDGHRPRHRISVPRDTSSNQHSQRQSSSSSRRDTSSTRRDSTSSILHHHSRRQQLVSSRRRHSIASVTSVSGSMG